MPKIKKNIIDQIKNDFSFQGAIIEATGNHPRTIEYWLKNNSKMLTMSNVLRVIMSRTGLKEKELYEPENVPA